MRTPLVKRLILVLGAVVLGYLGLGNFVDRDRAFQQNRATPVERSGGGTADAGQGGVPLNPQLPCASYQEHRKEVDADVAVPMIRASEGAAVKIAQVVDGDTLVVEKQDGASAKVHLIGVDSPESFVTRTGSAQAFGTEASQYVKDLVAKAKGEGLITYDTTKLDPDGRELAYIWLPSSQPGEYFNLNGRLVSEGYAYSYSASPKPQLLETFLALMRTARAQNRGLWSICQ